MNQLFRRIKRRFNWDVNFKTETILEIMADMANIDSCFIQDKLSKEYEKAVIQNFLTTEAQHWLGNIVYTPDMEYRYQIVKCVAKEVRQYDLSIVPEAFTRECIILDLDGDKWYIDPTVGNWKTKCYDIGNHRFYISRKKPKFMVKKEILTEDRLMV